MTDHANEFGKRVSFTVSVDELADGVHITLRGKRSGVTLHKYLTFPTHLVFVLFAIGRLWKEGAKLSAERFAPHPCFSASCLLASPHTGECDYEWDHIADPRSPHPTQPPTP